MQHVILRKLAVQRTSVVADDRQGFMGLMPFGETPGEQAKKRGLPGFAFAVDDEERIGVERDVDRGEGCFVKAHGKAQLRRFACLGEGVGVQAVRQHAHGRAQWAGPVGRDGRNQIGGRVRGAIRTALCGIGAISLRECGHVMQSTTGEAVAGPGGGHVAGAFAVVFGIQGIGHPEFQAGAELVFESGADLVVPAAGKDEMDAEGKAPNGHGFDIGDQLLVLPLEGAPAVDHQEDVTKEVIGVMPHSPPPAVRPDGIDVVRSEELLPLVEDLPYLGDGPSCLGRVQPGGNAPDMREIGEERQAAPSKSMQ